jgi:hypothetical protein
MYVYMYICIYVKIHIHTRIYTAVLLLYMCPLTIYVSSYYICVLLLYTAVLGSHLVELIDTHHAAVSKHHSTAFKEKLICIPVLDNRRCQPCR